MLFAIIICNNFIITIKNWAVTYLRYIFFGITKANCSCFSYSLVQCEINYETSFTLLMSRHAIYTLAENVIFLTHY